MCADRKHGTHADDLAAFMAGVAEANRRERGKFDGLIGQLPKGTALAFKYVLSDLRDFLLEKYSEDEVRRLLDESELRIGFRSKPIIPGGIVPDDVELALRLLNGIRSAMRCTGQRFGEMILGKAGVRGKKHQAGSKKGGVESGKARRGENSKRVAIVAAANSYHGAPASRVANIAKKVKVSKTYVRNVLREKEN